MSDDDASLVNGALLDDYRIVRRIGVGGMGSVYEAEHTGLGRRVALKTLNPEHVDNEDVKARFLREGQALARIRHPNIVGVSHVGAAAGVTYLVMDLLEGEDLAERIARDGALPSEEAVSIALAVLSAIEAAHEAGVVHRDLKPANVFLERTRREVVPRVLDFGISKISNLVGDTTRSVALLGSPHYMSPEQARSSKSVDWRTDQYAIGVILYESLCGRRPFLGETIFELVYAITSSEPAPLSELATLPDGLDAVVARAMAREPDERFPSIAAMAMALIPFAPRESQRRWQQEFEHAPVLAASSPGVDRQALVDTLASANRELPSSPPSLLITRPSGGRFVIAAALGAALVGGGVIALRGAATPPPDAHPPLRAAIQPAAIQRAAPPAPAPSPPAAPQAADAGARHAHADAATDPITTPPARVVAAEHTAPRRAARTHRRHRATSASSPGGEDEFRVR